MLDASLMPQPGNCTVSEMLVMGYEGATGADYQRLMKGGFLLEYYIADDCKDCKDSGGQCRVDDTVEHSRILITLLHRLVHIQHTKPNTPPQDGR
jgi:hypothetical protein